MTIEEAIKHAEDIYQQKSENQTIGLFNDSECKECAEQHKQLAEWLEELQRYRAIGTVEECNDARKRQRAKKPKDRHKTRYAWDGAYCPVCTCGITSRWDFCQECGQAIDWSEDNE